MNTLHVCIPTLVLQVSQKISVSVASEPPTFYFSLQNGRVEQSSSLPARSHALGTHHSVCFDKQDRDNLVVLTESGLTDM